MDGCILFLNDLYSSIPISHQVLNMDTERIYYEDRRTGAYLFVRKEDLDKVYIYFSSLKSYNTFISNRKDSLAHGLTKLRTFNSFGGFYE